MMVAGIRSSGGIFVNSPASPSRVEDEDSVAEEAKRQGAYFRRGSTKDVRRETENAARPGVTERHRRGRRFAHFPDASVTPLLANPRKLVASSEDRTAITSGSLRSPGAAELEYLPGITTNKQKPSDATTQSVSSVDCYAFDECVRHWIRCHVEAANICHVTHTGANHASRKKLTFHIFIGLKVQGEFSRIY